MRVLAIVSRDLEKGSTKYRIAQYTDFLKDHGIEIDFVRRKEITASLVRKFGEFDIVLNQKCLIDSSLSNKIFDHSRKIIFDFDDAIYTRPGKPHSLITGVRVRRRFQSWLKGANIITTANRYLAKSAERYVSKVIVVPMAIDMDIWKPKRQEEERQITIGWAGSPVNLPNIERLEPILSAVLKKYPHVKLAIFSGERPRLACPFEYHSFQPGEEPVFVQRLDIGLLPLPDEEYSRGKSPIKAIQYLACGIPVVGNVIGATAEILTDENSIAVSSDDEWFHALETLIHNRERRASLGQAGRAFVVKCHNIQTIREQMLRLFLGKAEVGLPSRVCRN